MKINLALIVSIIVAVGLVALGFTAVQISSERQELNRELESNTIRLADDFYRLHLEGSIDSTGIHFKPVSDTIISQYNFAGVAIYHNADSITPLNALAEQYIERST